MEQIDHAMNKWIKIIAVLVFLGIAAGILGYVFVYNKPHTDYEKAEAEYRITAEELFSHYTGNRKEAENTYNGKVLQVTGRVTAVETPDSLTIVVFALSEGMFGDEGIRLTMLDNHSRAASALLKDASATLKGYCTGFNGTDVILEKCSIVNE